MNSGRRQAGARLVGSIDRSIEWLAGTLAIAIAPLQSSAAAHDACFFKFKLNIMKGAAWLRACCGQLLIELTHWRLHKTDSEPTTYQQAAAESSAPMLVLLLLSAAMGLFLLLAAGASSSTVSEASFKLPKRPRQRVRSPPAVDPVPATAPYIYSIGDDRIDKYLPCYNFGYEALREVEGTGPGALEHVIIYGKRLPGTRAPLHTHDHDAILCIVKGQLTLFTNDTVKVSMVWVLRGKPDHTAINS